MANLPSGTVSVTDFGAKGDGNSDDRPAIQAALDSGASEVYIPSGTYRVGIQNGTGPRPPGGIRMRGASDSSTRLVLANDVPLNSKLLYVAQPNVTVCHMTLDGNRALQAKDEHQACLFATGAQGLTVFDVAAISSAGDGIYVYNGSNNTAFELCRSSGNGRNGITFGGGTTGGQIRRCTFTRNAVQQFDSEGGTVDGLTLFGNTFDGGGVSQDYVLTISGARPDKLSSSWVVENNSMNGPVGMVWTEDMKLINNTITSVGKPAFFGERTITGLQLTGNRFMAVDAGAVIQLSGTGTGSAPDGVIDNNSIVGGGFGLNGGIFGIRAEGCIALAMIGNNIVGPGRIASGFSGVYLRATNEAEPFSVARVIDNTIREWGWAGVSAQGNLAARLNELEVIDNAFSSVSGSMAIAMALDADRSHAARDIRVAGNTLSGGCTVEQWGTLTGQASPWGQRWVLP